MPALPLHEAGRYVAGAYVVFFVVIAVYVTIMAARLSRIERELGELLELAGRRRRRPAEESEIVADPEPTAAGAIGAGEH